MSSSDVKGHVWELRPTGSIWPPQRWFCSLCDMQWSPSEGVKPTDGLYPEECRLRMVKKVLGS